MKKVYTGKTLTSPELAETFYDDLQQKTSDPEFWKGLAFGHVDLTNITGGARKSEFIVIAGPQKSGKTTWGLFLASEFGKQLNELEKEELVLVISLEMRHSGLAGRVLANLSNIEVSKFRDYELEEQDWQKLDEGIAKLEALPVLWNVNCYTIEGVEALIEEYKDKIRVVIIDYFQLMSSGAFRSGKRHEQLEDISRRLKQIAMMGDTTVIALSQQTREALVNVKRKRDPNTLAGTQALARDADMLLIILPYIEDGEEVPHLREIYVGLSRNSVAGVSVTTVFSGEFARVGAPTINIPEAPEDIYEQEQSSYWNQ